MKINHVLLLFILGLVYASSVQGLLSDGLVHYWNMENSSITNITDEIGNVDFDGVSYGGSPYLSTTAKLGNTSLSCNPSLAYMEYNGSMDISGSFTACGWVYETGSSESGLISTGGPGTNQFVYRTGNINLYQLNVIGNDTAFTVRDDIFTASSWEFTCAIYDELNQSLQIYVNDSQVTYIDHEGPPPNYWPANNVTFSSDNINRSYLCASPDDGLGPYAPGAGWGGLLDEWGVWNRTLSEDEISVLYNNNTGLDYYGILSACSPDWTCVGYEACVDPAPTASCDSVFDLNSCGDPYLGDYSEFTPETCTYATGGGGGGAFPEDEEEPVLLMAVPLDVEESEEQFLVDFKGLYEEFRVLWKKIIAGEFSLKEVTDVAANYSGELIITAGGLGLLVMAGRTAGKPKKRKRRKK